MRDASRAGQETRPALPFLIFPHDGCDVVKLLLGPEVLGGLLEHLGPGQEDDYGDGTEDDDCSEDCIGFIKVMLMDAIANLAMGIQRGFL